MENQIFRDVNTGLDLNGPFLSITQQPGTATGIGTTVIRSPNTWIDSTNWQQRTVPGVSSTGSKLDEDTLMYGNDIFVTAGNAGYIATSPDSIIWNQTPLINGDSNLTWKAGAFANGLFVLVGHRVWDVDDPIAASSSDGINWTFTYVPQAAPSQMLECIATDGSKFIACTNSATDGSNLVTSTDGINWSVIADTSGGWSYIAWGNGVWVAGRSYGNYYRSTDGVTWVEYTVPGGMSGSSPLAYGNGLWIMMIGTNIIAHSTDDALTWTVGAHYVDGLSTYGIRDIVYGPAGWIAGSAGYLGGSGFLISSSDGYTWTYPNPNYINLFDHSVYCVFYGNGHYIAQGNLQIASATIPMDVEVPAPSAKLVGIATATFTGTAINQGTIAYQWYKEGVELSDSTYITGTATTTLTLSTLITPDDQGQYYFTADYVPTYSGVGDPRLGSGYQTGNAPNEPIQSGIGTINVIPLIEIIAQPSSFQSIPNETATFNVNASLTDNRYVDDLQYQWVVDGIEVNDGTSASDGAASTQTIEQTFTDDGTCTIPSSATDVVITLASGSGGDGGTADAQNNPDVVEGYWGLGGAGRIGIFKLLSTAVQRTLSFRIGKGGNDGSSGIRSNTNQSMNWVPAGGGSPGQAGGLGGYATYAPGGNGGPSAFITATVWGGGGGGGGGATSVRDPAIVVKHSHDYLAIAGGGGGAAGGTISIGSASPISGGSVTARGVITGDGLSFLYGQMDEGITSWVGHPGGQNLSGGGTGGGGGGSQLPYFIGTAPNPNPFPGSAGNEGFIGGAGGIIYTPGAVSFPGNAGVSGYNTGQLELESESTNVGDGYAHVSYVGEGDPIRRNTIISGSKTPSLILSSDTVGVSTVRCKISSETAGNSPQYTNLVNFAVLSTVGNSNINIEEIIGDETTANLVWANLANGEYVFSTPVTDGITPSPHTYVFYSPDRDMEVEMDLYGGMGSGSQVRMIGGLDITSPGAEGGYSRIRVTLPQGREFVIAGLIPEVNTPFIYLGPRLIACVGEAGDFGGGRGGGCNVAGEARGTAFGGATVDPNQTGIFGSNFVSPVLQDWTSVPGPGDSHNINQQDITANDTQATGRNGGRTLSCTKGIWWAQQGVAGCTMNPPGSGGDHSGYFRLRHGNEVTNTANNIARGFKAGYNIMQTAGAGDPAWVDFWGSSAQAGGKGGNGASGGMGGEVQSGGGGGSGYAWEAGLPGTPVVVDTQLGGSTFAQARVVLRVVGPAEATPEAVVFTQSNVLNPGPTWSSNENMQVVFTLEEGIGPQTLTFGLPPGSTDHLPSQVTYLIQRGAVYSVTSSSNVNSSSVSDNSGGDLFMHSGAGPAGGPNRGTLWIAPSLGGFVPLPGVNQYNVNVTYQFG